MKRQDREFLLLCALRYCLRRRSYAVGWICDLIEATAKKLSTPTLKNILKDLADLHRHYNVNDSIDLAEWAALQQVLAAELQDRES